MDWHLINRPKAGKYDRCIIANHKSKICHSKFALTCLSKWLCRLCSSNRKTRKQNAAERLRQSDSQMGLYIRHKTKYWHSKSYFSANRDLPINWQINELWTRNVCYGIYFWYVLGMVVNVHIMVCSFHMPRFLPCTENYRTHRTLGVIYRKWYTPLPSFR